MNLNNPKILSSSDKDLLYNYIVELEKDNHLFYNIDFKIRDNKFCFNYPNIKTKLLSYYNVDITNKDLYASIRKDAICIDTVKLNSKAYKCLVFYVKDLPERLRDLIEIKYNDYLIKDLSIAENIDMTNEVNNVLADFQTLLRELKKIRAISIVVVQNKLASMSPKDLMNNITEISKLITVLEYNDSNKDKRFKKEITLSPDHLDLLKKRLNNTKK